MQGKTKSVIVAIFIAIMIIFYGSWYLDIDDNGCAESRKTESIIVDHVLGITVQINEEKAKSNPDWQIIQMLQAEHQQAYEVASKLQNMLREKGC